MRYRKTSAMVCKNFILLWQEIPYIFNFFSTLKICQQDAGWWVSINVVSDYKMTSHSPHGKLGKTLSSYIWINMVLIAQALAGISTLCWMISLQLLVHVYFFMFHTHYCGTYLCNMMYTDVAHLSIVVSAGLMPYIAETCSWLELNICNFWIKYTIAFDCISYTGLFEMIVRVLTTCHTQHTWDRSICVFLFNRTTLQVFVTYLTGAPFVILQTSTW